MKKITHYLTWFGFMLIVVCSVVALIFGVFYLSTFLPIDYQFHFIWLSLLGIVWGFMITYLHMID